jgi:hypothetical protein
MTRRRPVYRNSIADENNFQNGATPPPSFTLTFDENQPFDYTFQGGGTTQTLRDLLAPGNNPPPGMTWNGLVQPDHIQCINSGPGIAPSDWTCTFDHDHVFWRDIDDHGQPTGRRTASHTHTIRLCDFMSVSWDDPPAPDRFGWYPRHWH